MLVLSRALSLSLPRVFQPSWTRRLNTQSSSESESTPRTTSFGFRNVPEEAKESLVKDVFDSVASSYDLMNDATSFGVHRLWKDDFVSSLKPGRKGPMRCLDVAGGTGDIALRILDYAREKYADRETSVEVADINAQMLKEGFRRFKKTMYHNSAWCPRARQTVLMIVQPRKSPFMRPMPRPCLSKNSPITTMTSIQLLLESEIARRSLLY